MLAKIFTSDPTAVILTTQNEYMCYWNTFKYKSKLNYSEDLCLFRVSYPN